MSIYHQGYANGIQKALTKLLGKEPENKASIEWKDWRIGFNSQQLDILNSQLKQALRSNEKLKEQEIAEIKLKYDNQFEEHKHKIEQLTQSLNHYKDLIAYYKTAQPDDEQTIALKVRIAELENHVKLQVEKTKDLENQLERQKSISEENKTYENVLPQNQSNLQREIDDILRDQRTKQEILDKDISSLKDDKLDLLQTIANQANKINELESMIELFKTEKSELEIRYRRLYDQIGYTAKSSYKLQKTYRSKPNLKQSTINLILKDKELSSSTSSPISTNTSTHTISSASRSNSHVSEDTAPTIVENAEQPIYKFNHSASAIPQKRSLSTTLLDKTNDVAKAIKNEKGKGPAAIVKCEQVDTNLPNEIENIPILAHTSSRKTALNSINQTSSRKITSISTNQMSNRNQQIPSRKKQSAGTSISSSPVRCNNRHRGDRSHMDGETCVSCINFYGSEVISANIDGVQQQVTGKDRIQLNSRHRQHRNERAKTPPGFWDLDFNTPERP
ncbi:hypothetical protein INT46_011342 [Mucor plumbeus]|uniref:DNA endonuclease activator Ctp1 C-terminal domain-containing protein n=1 Tax=Mucor plumbeus TaxID=97098 RepID=A0A8H7QMX0_9FUNG|nr:hypothetical protein INT46_011342 [Mucor plumbeus]